MCNGRATIYAKPAIEPLTLSQVLAHTHADSGPEDDTLLLYLEAARLKAEEYQRRAYINQTIDCIFDEYPDTPILLPMSPVSEVTSIKIYDTEDTETSLDLDNFNIDYASDPARISHNYSLTWPTTMLRPSGGLVIRYTAGYGATASDVPATARMAILLLVGFWYDKKGMDQDPPKAFYDLLRPDRLKLGQKDD
jgi:uncharacterized phiE125 gp8 family phage protein